MDFGGGEQTPMLNPSAGGVSGGSEYDSSPPLRTLVGTQPGRGRSCQPSDCPPHSDRMLSEMYSITFLQTQHTVSPRHPVSLGSSPPHPELL